MSSPDPDCADAQRELLRLSMRALGVATERDLRDYFRLPTADARARIGELVDIGELVPARVEGWKAPAFVARHVDDRPDRDMQALLSPFDSLIWERARTERLFAFRYRLESTRPPTSANTGTTCCRSCSANGSSRASI